jgi:hypothetical protein
MCWNSALRLYLQSKSKFNKHEENLVLFDGNSYFELTHSL